MERLIYHVDVNSAYLSWEATEQLKNGAEIDIRDILAVSPPMIAGMVRISVFAPFFNCSVASQLKYALFTST